jgi:SpoVK/Ycf46/Vps4 family AAA+-type ATPase
MKNEFEEQLKETIKAVKSGTSAVHLCGDDYNRIDEFVTRLALALDFTESEDKTIPGPTGPETQKVKKAAVIEWNYGYGQVDFFTRAKTGIPPEDAKMPFPMFLERYKDINYAREHVILIRNARHVLEGEMSRENLAQLQQTIVHLKKKLPGQTVLIYCDEKRFIPDELTSLVYFIDVKPPSLEELIEIARIFIDTGKKGEKEFTDKYPDLPEKNQFAEIDSPKLAIDLSSMCVGMSKDSFNQILEKAELEKEKNFGEAVMPWAEKTKKQYVDKSGLLKYVNVEVDIDNDVGGLGYLKWWLRRNEKAFKNPEEAKKVGISPAKGILLVGMPGCGKSLTAKAVAAFFGYPLLSLDLGTLMGKYLGESEGNLRRAISLAENSSPCVLWVDEIEKAFAGVGDESGVNQRLLGYLLTWLNDKKSQVFVMATANDVSVLPPEFLRRGRFDEIFYVDFPNERERKEIFKIHIGKVFGKNIVKEMEEGKLQEILEKEKISKEKLIEKLGKQKFDEITKNNKNIKNDFDELTRDKKRGDKKTEDKENDEYVILEDEKTYPGTEGYAGSDIEALVNATVIGFWNKEGKDKGKIETDIFRLLLSERKFMTPLKEVLAEKIKINKKKFGEYKLTPASFTKEKLTLFEDASEGEEKQQLEIAKEEICPPAILIKLAKNGSKKVKLALLENPSCPQTCIIDLMEDRDADIRAKAEEKWPTATGMKEKRGCLNCRFREGSNPARCRSLKYETISDIFSLCDKWKERTPLEGGNAGVGAKAEERGPTTPETKDKKACFNCRFCEGSNPARCRSRKYETISDIFSLCDKWKEKIS